MKKNKSSASIPLTASLAVALACAPGCAKKKKSDALLPAPAEPTPASVVITNAPQQNASAVATQINTADATVQNAPPVQPTAALPPPTTPEPAPTAPAIKSPPRQVIQMPATAPAAPTNFYSGDFSTNICCEPLTTAENYYFRIRGGYEHVNHGDNNDTFYLSVKFYANGGDLRERAGKNAWLVPDADAEFSHQYLPKPDGGGPAGSEEGVQLRASFFWPWMHWNTPAMSRTNSVCPLSRPLTLALGPTFNVGFDQLFDHTDLRFAQYFGARLAINHAGFIEVTGGATDGLSGTRAQVLTELPVFTSHDREVRYVLRGLWNTGGNSSPDVFDAGFFVETPLDFLAEPHKWCDLNPFKK